MSSKGTKRKLKTHARRNLLPLWLLLAGMALLLLAVFSLQNNSRPEQAEILVEGEPRLQVETDLIDHGNVKLNTVIHDEVRVTNVGDRPLRFTEKPYVQVLEGC